MCVVYLLLIGPGIYFYLKKRGIYRYYLPAVTLGAEEQSGEKMSGEMPVGENLLEIVPYNWDVMVENDKNLTVKEEVLIRNGNRENKQET